MINMHTLTQFVLKENQPCKTPFSNPWEQGPSMTIHMTFALQVSALFSNIGVHAFSAKFYLTQNKDFFVYYGYLNMIQIDIQ